jgi:hypothetical protein
MHFLKDIYISIRVEYIYVYIQICVVDPMGLKAPGIQITTVRFPMNIYINMCIFN